MSNLYIPLGIHLGPREYATSFNKKDAILVIKITKLFTGLTLKMVKINETKETSEKA